MTEQMAKRTIKMEGIQNEEKVSGLSGQICQMLAYYHTTKKIRDLERTK